MTSDPLGCHHHLLLQVEEAVTSTLQQIPVKLGKKTDVALLELVPNSIVGDTVKIVEDFMEDSW